VINLSPSKWAEYIATEYTPDWDTVFISGGEPVPNISTLVNDIYSLFVKREGTDLIVDEWAKHGANMTTHIHSSISESTRGERPANVIWASEIGKPCKRQLWYKLNMPGASEELLPHTKFKFLYGSLIEESVLALCKAAGHDVSREQESVVLNLPNGWKVKGKVDAVIDGHVVDVKSMSPYGFEEFKNGYDDANDKFGYRAQLDFYRHVMQPSVDIGYILAVDKVNGHMLTKSVGLWTNESDMIAELVDTTEILGRTFPPPRKFLDIPEGKSGNRKLCTECSYCEYKKECWPGVRTFLYAKGPIFLTQVAKQPDVTEVK